MKKILLTLLPLLLVFISYSQNTGEARIRELENEMKEAFMKRDTNSLIRLLSPDFVVNSPYNRVSTLGELIINMRKGGADTLTFIKSIEKITFTENLAIVMGQESRKATEGAVNVGKTFQRRFTDVWINNKKNWLLVARQSTLYSIE
jgi:hypothetical protein